MRFVHAMKFFFFFFNIKKMDKFVLKTLISRRVSYFVGILSRVGDIFLSSCSQVFSLLNLRFRGIFELHKSPVQKEKSCYK